MASIAQEVENAWESLKSDSIKWFTFIPEKTEIVKDAEGNGDWSEFLSNFGPTDVKFGIFRAVAVDDDSRRTKYILVAWTGPQCNAMKRSKVAANKTAVTQKFAIHVDVQASDVDLLSQEEIIAKLNSSTGAHKPKSYEF
ncbi:hypothetical protein FDP41_005494 [Naegleria fowleri]|uniref:ADF-H domain-containing protein n=1 Tax=Naegleria fowleri TaxID=5763 RepID=A0A6A5BNF3_NAEFO|nr:uncharacterized protein FDP41_005494 [Naegleria fowleri]KAF0975500.1 hypothetical protein FDP41_005494 [Naegleria fowleri]CAG4709901.1 unnamed protein product [Naegleria fowleri]